MNQFNGKRVHFIGVGGIGMSGLAQMCKNSGAEVSGSDRGVNAPENYSIFHCLRQNGITIYPQDGSFVKHGKVDYLIYSTAIESDNPDFTAAPDTPRLHRSQALFMAIESVNCRSSIAICGSCGKTTVTAMTGEALYRLKSDPVIINGGALKCFANADHIGNYRGGTGDYLVFEADESDKSLINYQVDYAILLNIGTDHYSKEELVELFAKFLNQVKIGAVMSRQVFELLKNQLPHHLQVTVLEDSIPASAGEWYISEYCSGGNNAKFTLNNRYNLQTHQLGAINALNMCAVTALLTLMGFEPDKAAEATAEFSGVKRRGEFIGLTTRGSMVFDDYAHNPEKITSAINTAHERITGDVYAIFQPHGYAPMRFMKEELYKIVNPVLHPGDKFFLLEPYYAGGTSSFSPSAKEVMELWRQMGADDRYQLGENREQLLAQVKKIAGPDDLILIMGARDNSLPEFAMAFTR